ncbi:hypothetical protein ACQPVP_04840 [Clostridium nigeriense]|uniref:hypothetical protein n=1 Tax=Clostridium nigeriense TaxID=1805470 RepID=UPI003D345E1D
MLNSYIEKIYDNFNSRIKMELSDLIYYIAYFLYLTKMVITTTMFNEHLGRIVTVPITLICLGLLLIKILLLNEYSKKNFIIMGILTLCAGLTYINSSYNDLIFLVLFIIGANNVNFKNIVKIFLAVRISILLIAMLSAKLGLIEDIIYIREGKIRQSFGSLYPTDFAAGVFFIALAYLYIKCEKLKIRDVIIFVFLGIGVSYFCDARVDSICIFGIAIYSLFKVMYNKKENLKINKFLNVILSSSMIICTAFSIIISIIYNNSNKIMLFLNKLLSNRLELAKKGIDKYGFTLFGQRVDMVGNGGSTSVNPTEYFFIDSSYLFVALRYGMIALIIFCILFTIYIKKTIDLGEITIAFIIMIIAINSIVAHRLLDIAYNPFLLVFFAKISINTRYDESERQII